MTGIDIVIETYNTDTILEIAISEAMHIDKSEICVLHDLSEYIELKCDGVICVVKSFNEGFKQLLSIDSPNEFDTELLLINLSKFLGTKCITPSNSVNPYAMKLYTPGGGIYNVFLDAKALDDQSVYKLDSNAYYDR